MASVKLEQLGLQLRFAQTKRIHDYRNRAEAHRGTGNHRAQEQTKERIKHAGGDGHAERVVDKREK